jgi:endo-1,4-beta-mannosidase
MNDCIVGRNIERGNIVRLKLSVFLASTILALTCVCGVAQKMSSSAQPAEQSSLEKQQNKSEGATPLDPVRLDGNYFRRGGHRFIPVGANWVPAEAAMEWPYQWDPASIETDFAQMHDLGFNTVRLDLVWAWFEPRPGVYNPEAFRQLQFLSSLANRYHIYLQPELFIGGEVGEAYWDVPYRQGRNPYTDPDMLRFQTDYAAEMARRFGQDSAIMSWDLTDEPPFWIVQNSTTDSMAINWTRLIAGAIRRYDSLHPIVVGTSTEDVGHGAFRPDNLKDEVDFFSVHPYTIYEQKLFPDPMLSVRSTFGSAFQTALSGGAGHPVMIQEVGASAAQYGPEEIAKYEQANLYSSLGEGANGFLIWCYTDAAPSQYSKVPYLRSPNETEFGLVTWDRKERPAAKMLKEFGAAVGNLDLTGVEPAPADAGIIVPNEWSKPHGDESHFGLSGPEIVPYTSTDEGGAVAGQPLPDFSDQNARLTGAWLSTFILAREVSIKADFPREYSQWGRYPMLFLPSPLTGTNDFLTHVHSDFWQKARKYVEQGGFLYASLNGNSAIPQMAGLFGARMKDDVPVKDVTLKVITPFGDLRAGDTFHYSVSSDSPDQWPATLDITGGTVIAVDQDGRPALVANQLGKGKTLLSAYPLESYLAGKPSAFETNEETFRIYQAFRDWTGLKTMFRSNQPLVEVSSLNAKDHGYVVLVNHAPTTQHVVITSDMTIHSMERIQSGGNTVVSLKQSSWAVDLDPYDGAIFSWK